MLLENQSTHGNYPFASSQSSFRCFRGETIPNRNKVMYRSSHQERRGCSPQSTLLPSRAPPAIGAEYYEQARKKPKHFQFEPMEVVQSSQSPIMQKEQSTSSSSAALYGHLEKKNSWSSVFEWEDKEQRQQHTPRTPAQRRPAIVGSAPAQFLFGSTRNEEHSREDSFQVAPSKNEAAHIKHHRKAGRSIICRHHYGNMRRMCTTSRLEEFPLTQSKKNVDAFQSHSCDNRSFENSLFPHDEVLGDIAVEKTLPDIGQDFQPLRSLDDVEGKFLSNDDELDNIIYSLWGCEKEIHENFPQDAQVSTRTVEGMNDMRVPGHALSAPISISPDVTKERVVSSNVDMDKQKYQLPKSKVHPVKNFHQKVSSPKKRQSRDILLAAERMQTNKRPAPTKMCEIDSTSKETASSGDAATAKTTIDSFRGVTFRPSGKWQAQCYYEGRSRYIGVFANRQKASVAYEAAMKALTEGGNKPAKSEEDSLSRKIADARAAAHAAVAALKSSSAASTQTMLKHITCPIQLTNKMN